MMYNIIKKKIRLIKSGGGTGPVKPGNLIVNFKKGANSCGLSER